MRLVNTKTSTFEMCVNGDLDSQQMMVKFNDLFVEFYDKLEEQYEMLFHRNAKNRFFFEKKRQTQTKQPFRSKESNLVVVFCFVSLYIQHGK